MKNKYLGLGVGAWEHSCHNAVEGRGSIYIKRHKVRLDLGLR